MKNFFACTVVLLFLLSACKKLDTPDPTPHPPITTNQCNDNGDFPDIPGWQVERIPVANRYNRYWKPYFLTPEKGFIVNVDGEILSTTNGGNTWQTTLSGTKAAFYCVNFVTPQHGFVGGQDLRNAPDPGDGGRLFETKDGGLTWQEVPDANLPGSVWQLHFLDDQHGLGIFLFMYQNAQGDWTGENLLARTEDGGLTWTIVDGITPLGSTKNRLHFLNSQVGYVEGPAGTIYKTIDGGIHWTALTTGLDYLNVFEFADESTGYACDLNKLLKTTDGGTTWQVLLDREVTYLHFFTPTEGITVQNLSVYDGGDVLSYCNTFFVTHDGGQTWEQGTYSTNNFINDWHFVNDSMGFTSWKFYPTEFVRIKRL